MPRVKLTKSLIDSLPTPESDNIYWDSGCPGFGVKVTPKGRKVFSQRVFDRRRIDAANVRDRHSKGTPPSYVLSD
jgi:hypothetical protein